MKEIKEDRDTANHRCNPLHCHVGWYLIT